MVQRTQTTQDRHDDARHGETWRDVWARQLRLHGTGTSRLTIGGRPKAPKADASDPLEQDARHEDHER